MKYMGSKSRIKKHIIPILQNIIDKNNIETYIEPFAGGMNVIDSIKCKNRIANDISTPLIELFKALVNGVELPKEVSNCFEKRISFVLTLVLSQEKITSSLFLFSIIFPM